MLEDINIKTLLVYIITGFGMIRYLVQVSPVVWTKNRDNLIWLGAVGVGLMTISVFDNQFSKLIPTNVQLGLLLIGGALFALAYFQIKKKYYTVSTDETN